MSATIHATTKNATSFITIRAKASVLGKAIGQIPACAVFEVVDATGKWPVALYNGVRGFVNPAYVTMIPQSDENFIGSEHFTKEEFKCHCGGKTCTGFLASVPTGVVWPLYQLLEAIRAEVNRLYGNGTDISVCIHGGYRDPAYNKKVGGAKNSQHMYAKAADIYVASNVCTVYDLGVICDRLNPKGGVGLGGHNIVHVDVRGKKARWWYTSKSWAAWKRAAGSKA